MTHDPKLEIYKLRLSKKENGAAVNFREFFRNIPNYNTLPKPITEEAIFTLFFDHFVSLIDQKGYNVDGKRKKGFIISTDVIEGVSKSNIHISSAGKIIHGILEGGKYGLERNLGEVEDKTRNTPITTTQIVADRFYFLVHVPIDYHTAIIMIQGYTEAKISDAFRDFLTSKVFTVFKTIISKTEFFIPNSFRQRYLEQATLKSLKFSSQFIVNPHLNGATKEKEFELQINIEIIDKTKGHSSLKKLRNRLSEFSSIFGKSTFEPEGGDERKLDDFTRKSARVISGGRELKLEIDNEEIKPVILLKEEGINVNEGGVPDFAAIDRYCKEILEEIKKELLPEHAVDQL